MKKITDKALTDHAATGKLDDARLVVVDPGMKCRFVATVSPDPEPKVLHGRRGGIRTMTAETALRYAQGLGLETIEVELKPNE